MSKQVQYVMKRGTTRLLVATDELLKRKDMILVDSETVKTRIAAAKRLLEEKKAHLSVMVDGIPEDISDGVKALAELNEDIAKTDELIRGLEKDKTPIEERKSENADEENEKVFNELVEEDAEIKKIRGMRKAKSVADYLESTYGISGEYTDDDLEKLRESAIDARTATLKEQFDSK